MIKFKYYKAVGQRADEVKAHIAEKTKQAREKQRALQEQYNSDGISLKGNYVLGLLYKEKPENDEYLISDGLVELEGQLCQRYIPNKRYRKGKELAQVMKEARCFNYSNYACSYFKVHATEVEGNGYRMGVIYQSVAGVRNENLIFKIPYRDEKTLPAIPDEFIEISEQEFSGKGE